MANERMYVIYYLFVTYHHEHIWTANCCARELIFYCPRELWAALRGQICAVAPVISRLGSNTAIVLSPSYKYTHIYDNNINLLDSFDNIPVSQTCLWSLHISSPTMDS